MFKHILIIIILLQIINKAFSADLNYKVSLLDSPILDIAWCGTN